VRRRLSKKLPSALFNLYLIPECSRIEQENWAVAVDTSQVLNRRQLRYESLDDLLRDADRVATGNSRTLGNWTLAQIFDHLAHWFRMAVDGTDVQAPRWVQFILWQWRKRSLSMPSKPGFKIPARLESELLPEERLPTDQCLQHLHSAVSGFRAASEFAPHPAYGQISRDDWHQLALRHAEMHMSFVVPQ
jgi:Protein of unknown function (DUF1569)